MNKSKSKVQKRKYFDLKEFAKLYPKAYEAFFEGYDESDGEYEEEDDDLLIFEYDDELYTECHDEDSVWKWSAPVWVELKWEDRPKG